MRLRTSLTRAFLVVGVSAVLAVGGLTWFATRGLFGDYANSQRASRLAQWRDVLGNYYSTSGSWSGADAILAARANSGPHGGQSGSGGGPWWGRGRMMQQAGLPPLDNLVLTDADGLVVAGGLPLGQSVEPTLLTDSLPIVVNDQLVGRLLALTATSRLTDPDAAYLKVAGAAIAGAVLVVAGLAVGAGALFARRLSDPILALTSAVTAGSADIPRAGGAVEIEQLGAAYASLTARLATTERNRRTMISDIAHELRTPLTTLRANLDNLVEGADAETIRRATALQDELLRLTRLVADLQLLSLADDGGLRLQRGRTSLSLLLRHVAELTAPSAADLGISLDFLPGPEVIADIDPDRITQAAINLVSNALRHTPDGGRVVIELDQQRSASGLSATITVTDTGPGIAPTDVERVFERFYRTDPARRRINGGSGLGLAIVQSIALAHGGRAWAESRPGQGGCFHLSLPAIGSE